MTTSNELQTNDDVDEKLKISEFSFEHDIVIINENTAKENIWKFAKINLQFSPAAILEKIYIRS